jgi:hypothetical protein
LVGRSSRKSREFFSLDFIRGGALLPNYDGNAYPIRNKAFDGEGVAGHQKFNFRVASILLSTFKYYRSQNMFFQTQEEKEFVNPRDSSQ